MALQAPNRALADDRNVKTKRKPQNDIPGRAAGRPSKAPQRHWQDRQARREKNLAYVESVLAGMSRSNAAHLRRFLAAKRGAGRAPALLANYANTISGLDRATNATNFIDLTPVQVETWLQARSIAVSPATVRQDVALFRHFLRWLLDRDDLPPGFKRATNYGKPSRFSTRRPIPPEHFTLLLGHFGDDLQFQALLHVLNEIGFRLEESLSLNVGSIEFDDAYGAVLRLPERNQARFRLKTGPRAPYAVECVGALRAWLAEHPFVADPLAPLFMARQNQQRGAGWLPLGPTRVYVRIKRACEYLGLPRYTPHWFRHTAATNKARLGWNAPEANGYFGWTPGSRMWDRVYVHLANHDTRERVRRDAGVDDLGRRLKDSQSRTCPACAEEIQAAAPPCRYCHVDIQAPHTR